MKDSKGAGQIEELWVVRGSGAPSRAARRRGLKALGAKIRKRGSVVLEIPAAAFLKEGTGRTERRLHEWERMPPDPLPPLAFLSASGAPDLLFGGRTVAGAYLDGRRSVPCEVVGVSGRKSALEAAVKLETRRRIRPTTQVASLVVDLLPPAEVDASARVYEALRKRLGLDSSTFEGLIRVFCVSDEVLALATQGCIPDEVAVFLAAYEEEEDQVRLANLAAEKGWGARELYALHKALPADAETAAEPDWTERYWNNLIPGLMPAGSTTTGGR